MSAVLKLRKSSEKLKRDENCVCSEEDQDMYEEMVEKLAEAHRTGDQKQVLQLANQMNYMIQAILEKTPYCTTKTCWKGLTKNFYKILGLGCCTFLGRLAVPSFVSLMNERITVSDILVHLAAIAGIATSIYQTWKEISLTNHAVIETLKENIESLNAFREHDLPSQHVDVASASDESKDDKGASSARRSRRSMNVVQPRVIMTRSQSRKPKPEFGKTMKSKGKAVKSKAKITKSKGKITKSKGKAVKTKKSKGKVVKTKKSVGVRRMK